MTITQTSTTIISLATLLALSGFAYTANAQEEITPRERYLEMQENSQVKKEEFEAAQQERKAEGEEMKEVRQEQMEEKRQEFEAASEEQQAEMLEKRGERSAALQEKTQERITNLTANISDRMAAAIDRIRQIIDRFQGRMDTLAERGVDVSEAQRALTASSAHLDDAEAAITNIDTLVAVVVTSESPREAWAEARATYAGIKTDIKESHASLKLALSLLKTAVAIAEPGQRTNNAVSNQEDTDSNTEAVAAPEEGASEATLVE
jgi:hypothetical protein